MRLGIMEEERSLPRVQGLVPMLGRLTSLRKLTLHLDALEGAEYCSSRTNFAWQLHPLSALTGLQSLALEKMPVSGLGDVLCSLPSLTELRADQLSVDGGGAQMLSGPYLHTLYLSGPMTSMVWLIQCHFPRLEQVVLTGCVEAVPEFDEYDECMLPPLVSFALGPDGAVAQVASVLARMPVHWSEGAFLCLGCNHDIAEELAMASMSGARRFQGMKKMVGLSTQAMTLGPLEGTPMGLGLRCVSLRWVHIDGESVRALAEVFPNLQVLKLEAGCPLDDQSHAQIVRCFPALSHLYVNEPDAIPEHKINDMREVASTCHRACPLTVQARSPFGSLRVNGSSLTVGSDSITI